MYLAVESLHNGQTPSHPVLFAVQHFGYNVDAEIFIFFEVAYKQAFFPETHCAAPAVEREHHRLGLLYIPRLNHGKRGRDAFGLECRETFEAVDQFESFAVANYGYGFIESV